MIMHTYSYNYLAILFVNNIKYMNDQVTQLTMLHTCVCVLCVCLFAMHVCVATCICISFTVSSHIA